MRERPILFSAPMVRALLADAKTQTRRAVRPAPVAVTTDGHPFVTTKDDMRLQRLGKVIPCPYGRPGDQLWVREAWRSDIHDDSTHYRASHPAPDGVKWKPSIHMPRVRSRITLEVTGVRVERLWEISRADVQAEGCDGYELTYAKLWESINGPGSWDANPWVWVVEFRRLKP